MLKPGRELDALVAEKVMGFANISWKYGPPMGEPEDDWNKYFPDDKHSITIPNYSTDIAAAWKVVEKTGILASQVKRINGFDSITGLQLWFDSEKKWRIGDYDSGLGRVEVEGETAPHAICLAALKSVGAIDD